MMRSSLVGSNGWTNWREFRSILLLVRLSFQMISGAPQIGAIRVFPDNSLQALVGLWWDKTEDNEIKRGRLLWAFILQSEIIPLELIPEGRGDDSGDHSRGKHTIRQLRINQDRK